MAEDSAHNRRLVLAVRGKGVEMATKAPLDFMIVGVQKAGTTFLAKALSNNKEVYFSELKELFFFFQKIKKWQFDEYIYENFWKAKPGQLIGEGTTTYFHNQRAREQILRYLGPELKIIVCLRHPVERMLSHFLHDYRRNGKRGDEPIHSEAFAVYRDRGLYADELIRWRDSFKNVHVMLFDDLVKSGAAYFSEAAGFLGITPHVIVDRPVNEGIRLMWNGDELTIEKPWKARAIKPSFPRAELEGMLAFYGPDIEKTSQLIGRDLSGWHNMPPFELIQKKFKKE